MSLDERGLKILRILVDNPAISGSSLEKEVGLSRKQISYSLEKINYYLKENGYEEIGRMKTGKFIISRDVINSFKTSQYNYDEVDYVLVEQERLYLIALILLQHKEELSINHFTSTLKISKNTVLNDLKKLQSTILNAFDLKIWYDRAKGYYIIGKEYEKRMLVIQMIRNMLPMITGEALMHTVLEIHQESIANLRHDVENVENILKVQYTDERIREIPYILYFILTRIQNKKYLDVLPEDYQHIVGTSEYGHIMHIFEQYNIQNTMDKIYIVSQFQVSSVNFIDSNMEQYEKEIEDAASDALDIFENLICIQFKDRKSLIDALIQHCKPALYRIRYHYHIESNILTMILPHHSYLFELTKHAIQPFERIIGKAFPEEELAYITILFGGWMTKEGTLDFVEKKRKAIVVCTNGISISNFLFLKLKAAFPEFEFLCALSSRSFYEYKQEYDVVFSTIHLDFEQSQFLVKPIMDDYDMQTLRRKVFNELLNKTLFEIDSSSLLHVIEKYVDVKDRKGLINALKNYLGEDSEQHRKSEKRVNLEDSKELTQLLTKDHIQIIDHSMNWKDAIILASSPLLLDGSITQNYMNQMIRSVEKDQPIWTIANGLILAHAGIEEGVNILSASLLKLPCSISFHGYMEASIIVVMATPNREVHLKSLYALIDIIENEADLKAMKAATKKEELLEIISKERN